MKAALKANSLDRFKPLLRSMRQRSTKVVLTLGGGGVRMFAHAVVLDFLEKIGAVEYLSEIWGASGGAIIGYCYSRGMTPKQIQEIGTVAFRGGIVPYLPGYLTFLKRIFIDVFSKSKESASLQVFRAYQRGLRAYLETTPKELQRKLKFYCTAFNLETQENDILSPDTEHDPNATEKTYRVGGVDAVMASSAFPVLFEPVSVEDEFGGRRYIDGGLIEDVPTQSVYKKWLRGKELGTETSRNLLVIAVNLYPSSLVAPNILQSKRLKLIPGYPHLLMSLNCAEYMRESATKAQKKMLRGDPNVDLWDINLTVPSGSLLNLDLIPRALETAERSVPEEFSRIIDKLIF